MKKLKPAEREILSKSLMNLFNSAKSALLTSEEHDNVKKSFVVLGKHMGLIADKQRPLRLNREENKDG